MNLSAIRVASTWTAVVALIVIVFTFAVIRLLTDVPNVASGTVPDAAEFAARYAHYPWLAYAHILPGVLYLALAPFQLSRRFRSRDIPRHRRIGRVAVVAGVIAGAVGVAVGALMPFGGALESSASVVFGTYLVFALIAAYRAIRRGDVTIHRRWMIRAFAIGLAVGTIRLWVGLFEASGLLTFRDAFGVAFWIAFVMHALVAELWIRARPLPEGSRPSRR